MCMRACMRACARARVCLQVKHVIQGRGTSSQLSQKINVRTAPGSLPLMFHQRPFIRLSPMVSYLYFIVLSKSMR